MIVVLIIGIVYALVLSNFNTKKKVHILDVKDIKEALIPLWEKGKRVDFYLYDKCQKSAIFINNIHQEEVKATIDTSKFENVEVFKIDPRGEQKRYTFTPIMIENKLHKVCFQYTLFPNGSNSSYILKNKGKYYLFYPYFHDVKITQDIDEAIELLEYPAYRGVRPDEIHD